MVIRCTAGISHCFCAKAGNPIRILYPLAGGMCQIRNLICGVSEKKLDDAIIMLEIPASHEQSCRYKGGVCMVRSHEVALIQSLVCAFRHEGCISP